ncbi:MAG: ABC transporter, partial [Deltaproteobacteria bacterium]|nr:ABC transporter [Deltaproteobacteria bacterium]
MLEHSPTAYAGSEEVQQAYFAHDLDGNLCYRPFALVLTKSRLLHKELPAGSLSGQAAQSPAHSAGIPDEVFELSPEITATAQAYTGVGEIELRTPQRLLARWHYTVGKHADACAFVKAVNSLAAGCVAAGTDREHEEVLQEPTSDTAAEPSAEITSETTMRYLGRIVSFARPWAGLFLLSLLLSVACTGAGLIPPYITMPLIDTVLIPFQNGKAVDESRVIWCLAALAGSAFLAWLLGWARTFVLARVSERVSAQLRNTIYTHLHRLSLDYFSEKRTGDLISRVSTDTDRICFFLSVYVLDLA